MPISYSKPTSRTPAEVVEQSNQPATALMEFVAQALEAMGFQLRTGPSPQAFGVAVGDRFYMVAIGGAVLDHGRAARVARQLRSCLDQLERP